MDGRERKGWMERERCMERGINGGREREMD
jgi:hypothetical protein